MGRRIILLPLLLLLLIICSKAKAEEPQTAILVPVLKQNIRSGETIKEADVIMLKIMQNELPTDVILDKENIIGMVSKKYIKSNQPIIINNLIPPLLIRRSDIVNAIYSTDNMILKTRAIAIESGAKGKMIKLRNMSSKKELVGVVLSSKEVLVNSD